MRSLGFALVAEAMARQGDHAGALAAINGALQGVVAMGEGPWSPELRRSHGLVLLAQNKLAEGETAFRQAVQLARRQQAKSWELRAVTSLARLWGEQGRREEARELLASIYGWFTEGFDTPDLTTAKTLLRELS